MIHSLAKKIVVLWGWRRALVAFLAGSLGALAMPPFGAFPALAVSFTYFSSIRKLWRAAA